MAKRSACASECAANRSECAGGVAATPEDDDEKDKGGELLTGFLALDSASGDVIVVVSVAASSARSYATCARYT